MLTPDKKILFILLMMPILAFSNSLPILTGAERPALYLPLLQNKNVGLFVNHTSRVGQTQLVDFLRSKGIHVTKIFVPEHGFRGDTDAGGHVNNAVDSKTNIPIISLYGHKVKPSVDDLHDVDILVFDIQDVGVRFYTYIASLQRLMESALEHSLPLIILDRPNPNGFYVDGPVLKTKSFTGLQPIPTVHGMTVGEYAKMLVGEQWLEVKPKTKAAQLQLIVIPNLNYTHKSLYEPPVSPSPNLPNIQSIYWYPSIGIMEGTILSVGRGTDKPFQVFGHPKLTTPFTFKPTSRVGAQNPPYENQVCHGWNLVGTKHETLKKIAGKLQIKYYIQAYQAYPDQKHFFPGSKPQKNKKKLSDQIRASMSEQAIRESWEPQLSEFKKIRKKYLLYSDFE